MSGQTTAGASLPSDSADATQGGLTTYVPQALLTAANARVAELETELKHLHSRWDWTEYWFDNLYPTDWGRCQAKYDQTKTGAQPVDDGRPREEGEA